MSDHEELKSLIAPWVLGTLEPHEEESMRMHIEACPECRETAAVLRKVVGAIPLAVDEVTPPARLRERILSRAAAHTSVTPVEQRLLDRPVMDMPKSRRSFAAGMRASVPLYAAAAAVVLALLLGVVVGDLAGRGPSNQVARFTLAGHQQLAAARATVIDLKGDGVVLVDFSGLPALESGRVYEVWLITAGGRADPAAVFVPDSNGGKVVLVNHPLAGYTEMAITDEVGPNGVQAPTQQPELYGNLA